ncbi:MAG TPA: hypothetical protein VMZ30_14550 [Pyrinomonadaceae bacterium]|nr:hypothetical protein [Pyrinomonadaceae bacterium]
MSAVVLVACLFTVGCGAIFNGTRQTIQATSSPAGAVIKADPGGLEFTTPASISLERKNEYRLTFSKEGYTPGTFQVQKSLNAGILLLDVLFTGLVGVVVDAATGAWYKLSPETATVTLEKRSASVDGPDRIEIGIVRDSKGVHIHSSGVSVEVRVQEKK